MLERYYGFKEEPFGATPDPRFLFDSQTHREALASLKYGFYSNRGFTALIAPPGTGKTTLLFRFLDDIRSVARTAFLFDTQCQPLELVGYLLRDLGIVPAHNGAEMRQQLKEVLITEARAGRRFVVVIDEAQNLSDETLEMVRLLTNFETRRAKLMQIVLAGQPMLFDKLKSPTLEQLRQRISTFSRLEPFSPEETRAYISHRLKRAGYVGAPLFTEDAIKLITQSGKGIPRTINNLCFNTLSLCCGLRRKQVDVRMVTEVVADQQMASRPTEATANSIPAVDVQRSEPRQKNRVAGLRSLSASAAGLLVVGSALGMLASARLHSSRPSFIESASIPNATAAHSSLSVRAAASTSNPSSVEAAQKTTPLEITVEPNQRLEDISVKYLGDFDEERLDQIEALNPQIRNLDYLKAGQRLWLPAPLAETVAPSIGASALPSSHLAPAEAAPGNGIKAKPIATKPSFEVTVGPNQRLKDIAVQYLGGFDPQRLHQIQTLNPKLNNPDHIEAGQKLWLPTPSVEPSAASAMSPANARNLP